MKPLTDETPRDYTPDELDAIAAKLPYAAVAEVEVVELDGSEVERHYGPGEHPGTGTDQQVHGGPAGYTRYKKAGKRAGTRQAARKPPQGKDKHHRAPVWKRDADGVLIESDDPEFRESAQLAIDEFVGETGFVPKGYVLTDDDEKYALTAYAADVRRYGKEEVLRRWDAESQLLGGVQQPGYKVIWMNDELPEGAIASKDFFPGSSEWNQTVWHELGHAMADEVVPEGASITIPGQYARFLMEVAGYEEAHLPAEFVADASGSMVAGEPYRLDARFNNAPAPERMVAFMDELRDYVGAYNARQAVEQEAERLGVRAVQAESDLVDVWFTFEDGRVEVRWLEPGEAELYRGKPGVRVAPLFADQQDGLRERIASILRSFVGSLERHFGPGPHPGTGTPQEAHAGDGGDKQDWRQVKSVRTLALLNAKARQTWDRYNQAGGTTVYQGTNTDVGNRILQEGLQRGSGHLNRPPSVYFFTNPEDALRFAATYRAFGAPGEEMGNAAVVEFDISDDLDPYIISDEEANGDFDVRSAFRIEREIPPEAIRAIHFFRSFDPHPDPFNLDEERPVDIRFVDTLTQARGSGILSGLLEEKARPRRGYAVLVLAAEAEAVERHLGPGPHPGTGSEQSVHAGGGGTKGAKGKRAGKGERRYIGSGPSKPIAPIRAESPDREATRRKYGPEAADMAQRYVADAAAREPAISRLVAEMAETFGADLVAAEYRLKGEESVARKIADGMREMGLSAEEAASDISDRIRYTMTFGRETFVDDVLEVQGELEQLGWTQYDHKWRNYFGEGDDYDGYNTVMVNGQTGETFELQLHTPESYERKVTSWNLYNEYRSTTEGETRSRLYTEMRGIWQGYEKPVGWERLPGILMTPATPAEQAP